MRRANWLDGADLLCDPGRAAALRIMRTTSRLCNGGWPRPRPARIPCRWPSAPNARWPTSGHTLGCSTLSVELAGGVDCKWTLLCSRFDACLVFAFAAGV